MTASVTHVATAAGSCRAWRPESMTLASGLTAADSRLPVLRFLLQGWLWLALLAFLAWVPLAGALWQVLLATGLAAVPLVVLLLHQATVRGVLRRQRFRPDSFLFQWYSGRLLALLAALCYGLLCALLLLVHLHLARWPQWLLLVLCVPVFLLVYRLLDRRLGSHLKPWVRQDHLLRWARIGVALLLAALSLAWQSMQERQPQPLLASIEAQRARVAALQGSEALQQFALWWQSWEGIKQFALGGGLEAAGPAPGTAQRMLVGLAAFLEAWMLFYLLGVALGALLLDRNEWHRSFAALSDADLVAAPGAGRLALLGAVSSFLIVFVIVPLAAYTEWWARSHRPVLQEVDRAVTLQLERIGEAWYQPGTWARIQALRSDMLETLSLDRQALQDEVNRAFDTMEQNVDGFLDWYYSLGAEYLRIGHLLVGDLDQLLAERLREHLLRGDAFARVEGMLQQTLAAEEAQQVRYLDAAARVMAAARVDVGAEPVQPLQELSLGTVLTPPVHEELLTLQNRLLAGTGGGAVAGVMTTAITAKLLSKMLAKGSVKLASKALAKLVAGKVGGAGLGAGAGAAAGAAAGSVVPGIGTAVGALIGGVAGGILAGVGIDKALIEFEEAVSRESFRAELLDAVDEARREFLVGLQ